MGVGPRANRGRLEGVEGGEGGEGVFRVRTLK